MAPKIRPSYQSVGNKIGLGHWKYFDIWILGENEVIPLGAASDCDVSARNQAIFCLILIRKRLKRALSVHMLSH